MRYIPIMRFFNKVIDQAEGLLIENEQEDMQLPSFCSLTPVKPDYSSDLATFKQRQAEAFKLKDDEVFKLDTLIESLHHSSQQKMEKLPKPLLI